MALTPLAPWVMSKFAAAMWKSIWVGAKGCVEFKFSITVSMLKSEKEKSEEPLKFCLIDPATQVAQEVNAAVEVIVGKVPCT